MALCVAFLNQRLFGKLNIFSFHYMIHDCFNIQLPEWAKLRVSCAFVPHVLMCLTCLRASVYFHCKRLHFFNVPYTISFSYVHDFIFLRALRVLIFLCTFIFFMCITCPNFFTCLMYLHLFTCLHFECVKFPGLHAIVGLLPLCLRGYCLGPRFFFSWVFRGSEIFSREYFLGSKFFSMDISWVQSFLVGTRGS